MAKIPIAFNQLTSFNAAAVSLGKGLSTVKSAVVEAGLGKGGTGYREGDILLVSGGTAAPQACYLRVIEVGPRGSIVRVQVITPGSYSSLPSNPVSVTLGTGTGATFTMTTVADTPPLNATWAELFATGGDVRWRDDGTDPTSSVGMLIKATAGTGDNDESPPIVYQGPLQLCKVIGVSAGSILNVTFYGTRSKQ